MTAFVFFVRIYNGTRVLLCLLTRLTSGHKAPHIGGAIIILIAIAINNLLNTIVMNAQINGGLFIKGLPLVIQ